MVMLLHFLWSTETMISFPCAWNFERNGKGYSQSCVAFSWYLNMNICLNNYFYHGFSTKNNKIRFTVLSAVCWFLQCRSSSNACFIYAIFRLCTFFPREFSLQLSYLFQGKYSAFGTGFAAHTFIGCFLTVAIRVCSLSFQNTIHGVTFSAPQSSQKTLAFELILRKKVSTQNFHTAAWVFWWGSRGQPRCLSKKPQPAAGKDSMTVIKWMCMS